MTGDGDGASARDERISAALEFAAIVLVTLGTFTYRLLPDVGYWDTAIFQAAPPVLGLTHPTGFPTWNVLGWLWTSILPLGTPAFELNLLTAVAGALAVGMMYTVARQAGADRLPGAAMALTVGLAVGFWRTAGRADPHPLHVLLALVVVSLLLAWGRGRRPRFLVIAALVFGLGMGNHMLTAMLAPGIAVYVLAARPSILREARTIAMSVLALVAGLAVYLYVPVRGGADPAIAYDFAPTTWDQFLRYVLGQDFQGSMAFLSLGGLAAAARELPTAARQLGESMPAPVAIGLLALAAAGLANLLAAGSWRTAWLLASTAGVTLYARLTYANGDIERYALFPMAVLGILAAVGFTALWRRVTARRRGSPDETATDVATGVAEEPAGVPDGAIATAGRVLPGLLLALPIALFALNGDRVKVPDSRCYVNDVVARAPEGAGIVAWWSMTTPLWYAQAVEGQRPDLTVVSAGRTVVDEIERFRAEGRPVLIIQLDGEVSLAREAGYPMTEERFCGTEAWLIAGPPSIATP